MENQINKSIGKGNKWIYTIDLAIVSLSLIMLVGFLGYARPMLIYPENDLVTTNTSVLFSFEKGSMILIDDNPDFTSPEKIDVKDNLIVNLKPGEYYWKVDGVLQSEVRKLIVKSEIGLRLRPSGNEYEVVNSGNTRLSIDVYSNNIITGRVILDPEESENVSGIKFVGSQHD